MYPSTAIEFIRRIAAPPEAGNEADGQLLRRFVTERDGGAFSTIVRRHGPMVLGVCRRVMGNQADAEDAFQATFLVLARKAAALAGPDALANWLYGVAYRTAVKVRGEIAERHLKERQVRTPDGPSPDAEWSVVRRVLDEEINRLPPKFRTPFVLCYLDGLTNDAVARRIGCPKGTVASRLATARERLRGRLTRRGVSLSAGLFASLLEGEAFAAKPLAALVSRVTESATLFAAGQAVPGAAVAEGVIFAMSSSRYKLIAALTVGMGLMAAGLAQHVLHAKPQERLPAKAAPAEQALTFSQVPVSTDDILSATGLNIYKFQLGIPKGEKFRFIMRQHESKEAAPKVPFVFNFASERDAAVVLCVSILRRDQKLAGALLSEEEDFELRLAADGASPPGLATIIKNPLRSVPSTEKLCFVARPEKQLTRANPGQVALIVLARKKLDGSGNAIEDLFPRAEWVVERLPKGE